MDPNRVPTFLEAFAINPTWIFFGVAFGAVGVIVGAIGFLLFKRRPHSALRGGIGALILGALALIAGMSGYLGQDARTTAIVNTPGLSKPDQERIRHYDAVVARDNLLAGSLGGLPALGLGALILWISRHPKQKSR